jgi:hypothetical protein
MYLLIRYPVGIIVEAVVLATGKNRMRAAAAGFPDTIELRRSGAQWFSETNEPVEFDFLMATARKGETDGFTSPARVVKAAGSTTQH